MDFKEIFKKFWFVMLIGVVFLVYVVVLTVQTVQAMPYKVSSKVEDGKSAVYSVDGDNYYYADDLYDDLYELYGQSQIWSTFNRAVVSAAIDTTTELSDTASNYAQYYLQYYDEDTLNTELIEMGYSGVDELSDYFLDMLKANELLTNYLETNYDTYVAPVVESENPKKIYHILINVADVTETENEDGTTTHTANPTDEEKAKLDEVLAALDSGEEFTEVAKEYSDDSTASDGGLLGVVTVDSSSGYAAEFAAECLEIEPGETSAVITTQYGYHIIYCEEATKDDILADSTFISEIETQFPTLTLQCIMDTADELGFEIVDEDLKTEIESELSTDTSTTTETETTGSEE